MQMDWTIWTVGTTGAFYAVSSISIVDPHALTAGCFADSWRFC